MTNSDGIRGLSRAANELTKIFNKLASGKRINQASDDPAGLAIAKSLEASAAVSQVAQRNIGDAVSFTQVADGALDQIGNISTRLSELATQSANGTLSDAQRSSLNQEYQQLSQEAQRIAETTQFNGVNPITSSVKVQVGNDGTGNSQIAVSGSSGITPPAANISTQAGAQAALSSVTAFADSVAALRGTKGAEQSRLEVANRVSEVSEETALKAKSAIEDADVATEVANLVSAKIRQDTNAAMAAQANKLQGNIAAKLLS